MADKKIQIGAELTINNNQVKTEFQKAGELAGKSVAEGLDKQQGTIVDKINDTIEEIRVKIEALKGIDWNLVDVDKTDEDIKFLDNELNSLTYTVENLKYGWQEFGDEGAEAFANLNDTIVDYKDEIENAKSNLKGLGDTTSEAMDGAEEQVKETTEAVKELNDTASQGISENGGLGKMLKFLSSKEIINFFYRNLKKIGEKLIELSGDSEMLANKRQPIQDKFEAVGGYLGKALVPAVDNAINEIDTMTDELTKAGEDGSSALQTLQLGLYRVGQAFNAVMKIIKQYGQLLGKEVADWIVLGQSFWKDFYDTAKSVIEGIGNADNWIALGNNIKYGIVQGVNGAIESLNGMLGWMKDKLGIDLGSIDYFDAGTRQSYTWDIDFGRTKEAFEDVKKDRVDTVSDMGQEWKDLRNNAIKGAEDLKNTSINTNKKIKDDTKKSLSGGKNSVKGAYEELEEEAVDVWEELDKLVEDHQKSYDKLIDEIEKVGDKYNDLRDEAKKTREEAEKSLKSYNEELEKSQAEAITDLGQRYVELKKDLIGVDDYMKKIANELSWKELQSMQDRGYSEYRGYDLKKIIDLKEKLEEMKLIEENTTEEQRKSEEFTRETSKAQEILNKLKEQEVELENKKTKELEKQAIAQAMMEQADGKQYIKTLEDKGTFYYDTVKKQREQVQNEDNIQYAKQLESQVVNLNQQLEEFSKEKDNEVEILITTTAKKIDLENEYQKVFEENVKKQQKELDNLIAKEQELINKRREYLSMGGSASHNAYGGSVLEGHASVVGENGPETIIARQSSYVQPRNASNNYSTINNDNSFSINGISVNVSNMDEFLNELKEKLTYRS